LRSERAGQRRQVERAGHGIDGDDEAGEGDEPGNLRGAVAVDERERPVGRIGPDVERQQQRTEALDVVEIGHVERRGELERGADHRLGHPAVDGGKLGAADCRVHARLADQQGEEGKPGDEELDTRRPGPPLRLGLDHSIPQMGAGRGLKPPHWTGYEVAENVGNCQSRPSQSGRRPDERRACSKLWKDARYVVEIPPLLSDEEWQEKYSSSSIPPIDLKMIGSKRGGVVAAGDSAQWALLE